jgi:PIN domain nuclease of toxin-antitoxin system
MPYVTDTHSLVWHLTSDPQLSASARQIFRDTDENREQVYIPCIELFELLILNEKRKVLLDVDQVIALVRSSNNYRIAPMCAPIIERSRAFPREDVRDPWDRLIAATASHLGFPLITRDANLRRLSLATVW